VPLLELDSELVVLGPKHVHSEVGQAKAVSVLVDLPLLALLVLGDHHHVIEQENASLVSVFLLFFLHVCHFGDSAEADESTGSGVEVGSLGAKDGLLDFCDLRDVVGPLNKLGRFDPVVDASKHVTVHVGSVVNATKVPNKVVLLHLFLRLDALVVKVGIEEDHGIGKDKDGIWCLEARNKHLVALDIAFGKHFHELLNHLSLTGDSNLGLELT